MTNRIIKYFKSTILGLAFIAVAVYLMINSIDVNVWILGSLLVSGVMLLFVPDRFIEAIEKLVFGKILFKKDDENKCV